MKRVARNSSYVSGLAESVYTSRRKVWEAIVPDTYQQDKDLQRVFVKYISDNQIHVHHDNLDHSNDDPYKLYLMLSSMHSAITNMYCYKEYFHYAEQLLEQTHKSVHYLQIALRDVEITAERLISTVDAFVIKKLPTTHVPLADDPMLAVEIQRYFDKFASTFRRRKMDIQFLSVDNLQLQGSQVDADLDFNVTGYGTFTEHIVLIRKHTGFYTVSEHQKPQQNAIRWIRFIQAADTTTDISDEFASSVDPYILQDY